tara:strand:- start:1550 stop:2425 length:876 start_codon:yes stop_codon:yes gene_type:complete
MKRFFIILLIFNFSCQIIDQPEKAPSFISIDNFQFSISNNNQGSNSEKISDAWIYINGNLEGVYDLPARIPLHYEGVHELSIYPGIKRNGISADRKKYPFYTPFDTTINLIPDSILTLTPKTEYEEQLYFWIENFEDPQHKFETHTTSQVDINIIESPLNELFEGDAGMISMDSADYFCEIRTNELDFNSFPKNLNIPAYIEMNYANNYPFTIGILHKDASLPSYQKFPLITLIPTYENEVVWNKTYLFIPDATNFFTSATEFDLYISARNENFENDIKVLLDNFKVIFRQ